MRNQLRFGATPFGLAIVLFLVDTVCLVATRQVDSLTANDEPTSTLTPRRPVADDWNTTSSYPNLYLNDYGEPCNVSEEFSCDFMQALVCNPWTERCDCSPTQEYSYVQRRCRDPPCYESCYYPFECVYDSCTLCYANETYFCGNNGGGGGEYIANDFNFAQLAMVMGAIVLAAIGVTILVCMCLNRKRKPKPPMNRNNVQQVPMANARGNAVFANGSESVLSHQPANHHSSSSAPNEAVKISMEFDKPPPSYFEAIASQNRTSPA